jgi:hypothetical protein
MLKRMLFTIMSLSVAAGCAPTTTTGATGTTKVAGETKKMFDQDVSTWATLDDKKVVTEFGVTIPVKSIENAPTAADSQPTRVILQAPAEVQKNTFINLITLDYNPHGHEPVNIYTIPHYDFHAYSLTEAEINAIDCKDETLPAAEVLPKSYMFLPPPKGQCVPTMGFHASDVTSGELKSENPDKFTKTMIIGYYKGIQDFVEPMITKDYLLEKKDFTMTVGKPSKLGKATMYPTMATGTFDKDKNTFSLVFSKFESMK